MRKFVGAAAAAAALSLAGWISLAPASAALPDATISRDARPAQAQTTDISARRRYYRRYGYYGPRYYRPYYRPYYRSYYRPYYRPYRPYYGYGYGYPYYRSYYRPAYYRPYPYYGYGYGGPRFYGPGFSFGFGW